MAKTRPDTKNPPAEKTNSTKKKKRKKHLLSAPESAARKGLNPSRENPFEAIWSRRKFDVIGKRPRNAADGQRVSRSRSLALHKRNKTLLEDYKKSRKSSVFIDRRIGEGDDALGEFDKGILRLQRERQRKLKKESKYNLSDGEEDVLEGGFTFSRVDDFDEEIPFDEDEDFEPNASSKRERFLCLQSNSTEGSLSDIDENKPKSKKQVYEEIMAKSKFHKALKAKEKEADEQLLGQLDKDFSSLAQSEALISLTQPTKMTALKALLNQNDKKPSVNEEGPKPLNNTNKEKPDSYDMLIKEIALDACARPSDRTKTPEEIAQEEKERLELLEEERKKRMLASENSDDESNDDADDDHAQKITKHVSGDDLGDATSFDEKLPAKKGWANLILERKDDDDDSTSDGSDNDESGSGDEDHAEVDAGDIKNKKNGEEEDDEEEEENDDVDNEDGTNDESVNPEKLLSGKDWEQSDEEADTNREQAHEDSGQTYREHNLNDSVVVKQSEVACKMKPLKEGMMEVEPLPFVIDAPKNMTELCSLFANRSDSEIIEAVNRIRVCNAVKLSAQNRKKMQVFYGVLLQYFAVLTTKMPLNLKLINFLVRPLVEMSMDTPYFAAICARERLTRTRKQFCEDIKDPERSSWPSLKTLMLLRLWSLAFPCSDFRHVVMTPATLLMCEYLMRCPILHSRDAAVGSFLCSMLLLIAKQSCKFFPEALIFLQILLMSSISAKVELQMVSQCYEFLDQRTVKPLLWTRKQISQVEPLEFFMLMELPVDSPVFDSDNFRVSVLSSAIETLGGFINLYGGLCSFPEIFLPVSSLLSEVLKQHGFPDSLRGRMENIAALIKQKSEENQLARQPLQMRKQKPVPLKLINPKFEDNYEKGRDYDPDRERVERKKLKKLLKKEAKGAVRELRKDNYFILEAKERDRLMLEEEKAEQYGKARAFLQEQEHAFKSGQLGKGRKRRR